MIINKGTGKVSGYIEYSYRPYTGSIFNADLTEEDLDCMFESDTFNSLEELITKMQPSVLEEIKQVYDAEEVYISCISFKGKSQDGLTSSDLSLFTNGKSRGFISTQINNDDVESRLLANLQQVKQIIDNTVDGFPTKF